MTREERGIWKLGTGWVVPCYGGWSGVSWFTHEKGMAVPAGLHDILGKAVFETREQARVAWRSHPRRHELDQPIGVDITLKARGR
jgi:hypothetical protein